MLKGSRHRISVSRVITSVVRSERINALRKQYDAFLEEDKQRKDRNCFILERLDKMCFNPAVVPLQNKRNISYSNHRFIQVCSPTNKQIGNFSDNRNNLIHHVTSEFPKEIVDESLMMQEISKKYILIPKINTTPLSNQTTSIESFTNDGSAWMHKYEILNQLKNNELDTQLKRYEKYDYSSQATTINNELENNNSNLIDKPDKYKIQKEVKQDVSKEELITETTRDDVTKGLPNFEYNDTFEAVQKISVLSTFDQNEQNRQSLSNTKFEYPEIEGNVSSDTTSANNILEADIEYNNNRNSVPNRIEVCSNINNGYTEIASKLLRTNEPTIVSEKHLSEQEKELKDIQNETGSTNALSKINPNDSVNEIYHEIHSKNLKQEDDSQYPVEIIKPKSNIKLQVMNVSSEECINLKTVDSSYPNNPEDFTDEGITGQAEDAVENSDNLDITSGIEEFDAEQREMFYSEEAQENYEFDQSNITGAYNQAYDANNENYQQNTEYYEGVHMEQAYPLEINEHEEPLQRYDQNYEEQYSTYEQEKHEQNYEDPQQYEQFPQNVQPPIDDIIQPEVDHLQYEQHKNETQAQVEEQLDREQGLIEKQIVDTMTVENQQIEEKQPEKVVD